MCQIIIKRFYWLNNFMLNADIVDINDEQAYASKLLASNLSTAQLRKRGMIDMLGIACAINYLNSKKIKTSTAKSVYRVPLLFEEFKITDIYYGSYRIDVISLYKEKTVKIPKIHFDMDIMPHFYFIVQIGAKIKEAKMIGFINSKDVAKCSHDTKYYYPTLDLIFDEKKFLSCTKNPAQLKTPDGKHIDCIGLFLKFIDNDLSSVYKRQLIQHLMNCDSCRARFIDTIEFEKLADNIRLYPDLAMRYDLNAAEENTSYSADKNSSLLSLEESIDNIRIKEGDSKDILELDNFVENDTSSKNNISSLLKEADKDDNDQAKKNVIDAIFNEIPKFELPQLKSVISAKNKHALIVLFISFFFLFSFAIIALNNNHGNKTSDEKIADFEEYSESYPGENYDYTPGVAQLIPREKTMDEFFIRQPEISQPAYSPTISKISWEAPESLVKKDDYTKFLQLIGKNIKLNLQNDLLLVNDVPMSRLVKADIKISSGGEVETINVTASSGSPAIDNSVKKVINDTFKYMKPPSHGLLSRSAKITLILELN